MKSSRLARPPAAWQRHILAACGSLALVDCDVSCPQGSYARHDQCVSVRAADAGDGPSDAAQGDAAAVGDSRIEEPDTSLPVEAGCAAGHVSNGTRCVLAQVYVDSTHGNDGNDGSAERPLKTFYKAVTDASDDQIINFAPGVYAAEAGDQFTAIVPNGVTLRTRPNTVGRASFVGNGLQSLVFEGSAQVSGIDVIHFDSPLRAGVGEQRLSDVGIVRAAGQLIVASTAQMTCDGCRFEAGPSRREPLIQVRGAAALKLTRSTLNTSSEATCVGHYADAIQVIDSASLVLQEVRVSGSFNRGVFLSTEGATHIALSTFARGCSNNSLVWDREWSKPSLATVDIEDSVFEADAGGAGGLSRVRVRRSQFPALFWALFTIGGVYDLGRPPAHGAEPGRNTFGHVAISGTDVVFFASGNTWNPGQQGADPQGQYAEGAAWSVTGDEIREGENLALYALKGFVRVQF